MKVGWILCGNIMGGSPRQIGINTSNWLNKNGVESLYFEGNDTVSVDASDQIESCIDSNDFTHLVFQKVCMGKAFEYLKRAKGKGIKTAYTMDDFMGEGFEMVKNADGVVANSDLSVAVVRDHLKVSSIHIPTAYESPPELCKENYDTDDPCVYWFGQLGNSNQVTQIQDLVQAAGYRFEVIASGPWGTKPWTLQYYNDLVQADIVIIPEFRLNTFPHVPLMLVTKGANRPTMAMVLGVPVVASPFPSYTDLISNWEDGVICTKNTHDDFRVVLHVFQEPKIREKMGRRGRAKVVDRYSQDTIGKEWIQFLQSI